MNFQEFDPDAFPISIKTYVPAVIFDEFNEHHTVIKERIALEKLDANEQNEKHIVNATQGQGVVPTPTGNRVEHTSYSKSRTFFKAPPRCFVYDTDFFEKMEYYADTEDIQFVQTFNNTHKFIKMTTRQLEEIFLVLEQIVRDDVTEIPEISQLMFLLSTNPPPYPIIEAIYKYWLQKAKLRGSVLHMKEYPPEHSGIRSEFIKKITSSKKIIKSPVNYIKKLHTELETIQAARQQAIDMVTEQLRARKENIIFLRSVIRRLEKVNIPHFAMVIEPQLRDLEIKYPEESQEVKNVNLPLGIFPEPPEAPAFLSWCQDQHTGL